MAYLLHLPNLVVANVWDVNFIYLLSLKQKGMKDPLTKSEAFVTMLREHCSKVQIRELNAGASLLLSLHVHKY